MKAYLFSLLLFFPALCLADSYRNLSAAMLGSSSSSPFSYQEPRHGKSVDLTNWYILHQAYSAPYGSEPPIIIYHARDLWDFSMFKLNESVMRPAPYSPQPKIIYEIGPGRYERK